QNAFDAEPHPEDAANLSTFESRLHDSRQRSVNDRSRSARLPHNCVAFAHGDTLRFCPLSVEIGPLQASAFRVRFGSLHSALGSLLFLKPTASRGVTLCHGSISCNPMGTLLR